MSDHRASGGGGCNRDRIRALSQSARTAATGGGWGGSAGCHTHRQTYDQQHEDESEAAATFREQHTHHAERKQGKEDAAHTHLAGREPGRGSVSARGADRELDGMRGSSIHAEGAR